jgi:hypothetical protein
MPRERFTSFSTLDAQKPDFVLSRTSSIILTILLATLNWFKNFQITYLAYRLQDEREAQREHDPTLSGIPEKREISCHIKYTVEWPTSRLELYTPDE